MGIRVYLTVDNTFVAIKVCSVGTRTVPVLVTRHVTVTISVNVTFVGL